MPHANIEPSTRLFGILARRAERVVVFRRGPSKHVQLLTWDTHCHEVRSGQWLKGRVYEQRCDLSPSGEKLVYLAANHKPPYHAWTAVSRPPFFTALALWPNHGTYGGGGLFDAERSLLINRLGGPGQMAEGFRLPSNVRVLPIASWAGRGEDDPIRSRRMKRDGWVLADAGAAVEQLGNAKVHWEYVRPERWRKTLRHLTLERCVVGVGERGGPWYVVEHRVLAEDDSLVLDLGRSDWADWSHSGELLLARDGKLWRAGASREKIGRLEEVADLGGQRFEEVPPTPAALCWEGRQVQGKKIT